MMKGKKLLVIGGAAILTVGIVGASTAFAHPGPDRAQPRKAMVNTVADVLDLEKQELISELKSGKTLAEVAQENGVGVEDLIGTLVDLASERMDAAVESGKVTAENAEEKLSSVEERISAMVDRVMPMARGFGGMIRHRGGHSVINAASDELGIGKQELVRELRGGNTISGLAAEYGVGTEAIIDTVVSGAGKGLARAVANGAITQEKADERLAMIEEKVTEAMDRSWPVNAERQRRGPGFGRHNSPGMEARGRGDAYGRNDHRGNDVRQSSEIAGSGLSALQGFGTGIPQ